MNEDVELTNFCLSEKETSELLKAKTRRAILNQDMVGLKKIGFNNTEIKTICQQNAMGFDRIMSQSNRFLKTRIKIEIDHCKFNEVTAEINQSLSELSRIQKLIKYEAPKAMMISLFGMSVERFKFWRCVFGLEKRGRAPSPNETQKHQIWQVWNMNLNLSLVDRLIKIYEETKVPLRSVWAEIHSWTDIPERYKTFDHKSRFIIDKNEKINQSRKCI